MPNMTKERREKIKRNSLTMYNQLKELGMTSLAEAFKDNTLAEYGIELDGEEIEKGERENE